MDIVWLVLDSLTYEATSLSPEGAKTTPKLAALAEERGVVFTRAYAPGPSSPSSHASFLTGKLPSTAGMHEANPVFDGRVPTIADQLAETHRSHLVSVNPFLFSGLDESFDVVADLAAEDYLLFDDATDPRKFGDETDKTGLGMYWEFLRANGTPVRNVLNGLSFKRWQRRGNEFIPNSLDDGGETYQYAEYTNNFVRSSVAIDEPSFVVANYMDVHPPLSASAEALTRFGGEYDRADLPIGTRGEDLEEHEKEAMWVLYLAATWDLDQKIGPLVEELLEDGSMVIVTADHGPRFARENYLTERRLHVPLVVFQPEEEPRRVDTTVSLQSLPRTTMETAIESEGGFDGQNLLTVDGDKVVITEYLHRDGTEPGPVSIDSQDPVHRDLVVRRGDTRIQYEDGQEVSTEGTKDALDRLRTEAREVTEFTEKASDKDAEFDDATRGRLEDLGYL
jgi:arylsulfatase A-like enzyme